MKKVFKGQNKCIFFSYDDKILLYNLDFFQGVKQKELSLICSEDCYFMIEEDSIDINDHKAKRRKFSEKNKPKLDIKKFSFKNFGISPEDTYFAFTLKG